MSRLNGINADPVSDNGDRKKLKQLRMTSVSDLDSKASDTLTRSITQRTGVTGWLPNVTRDVFAALKGNSICASLKVA